LSIVDDYERGLALFRDKSETVLSGRYGIDLQETDAYLKKMAWKPSKLRIRTSTPI
jgi:hypothetical protein